MGWQKNLWAKRWDGKKMGWQKDGMADRVNPITDLDVNAFIFCPQIFLPKSRIAPWTGKKRVEKMRTKKGWKIGMVIN